MMRQIRKKQSWLLITMLLLLVTRVSTKSVLSKEIENLEVEADLKDDIENSGNTKLLPLMPIPHLVCTGVTISGVLESCFPVGCICAKGAGICNLKNECIRTPNRWRNKRSTFQDVDFDYYEN